MQELGVCLKSSGLRRVWEMLHNNNPCLLITYYVPGTVLLSTTLKSHASSVRRFDYDAHFAEEKTETQRG